MNAPERLQSLKNSLQAGHGITAPLNFRALDVLGLDAQDFLQGQLTLDLSLLKDKQHRLTAWCNAKGRVWALLRIWRRHDGFRMLVPADQSEAFAKRLAMFVLRAKVSIQLSEDCVCGVIDSFSPDHKGLAIQQDDPETLVCDKFHALRITQAYPCDKTAELRQDNWLALRMLADEPQISAATQEKFLPQSLNLEALGGLHFNKGCYVGQEIVARVHYKGRTPQQLGLGLNPKPSELSDKHPLYTAELGADRLVQWVENM